MRSALQLEDQDDNHELGKLGEVQPVAGSCAVKDHRPIARRPWEYLLDCMQSYPPPQDRRVPPFGQRSENGVGAVA
ncbi:hypothetical protein HW555_006469 [Spodoptera exigua]|uniref:Uncharacterized protein n=1 Tax=Spodoptera exigua TaxID=7107 RepID=A0A835GI39_SPOEX|nr:hypothetical protein HW555_006469 [Spodoptera exigua]